VTLFDCPISRLASGGGGGGYYGGGGGDGGGDGPGGGGSGYVSPAIQANGGSFDQAGVRSGDGEVDIVPFVPTPPTISGTPGNGAVGAPYQFDFALGGTPAPTTTVTSGSLPPGLTLSNGGALSGTPIAAGTYSATVTATNGNAPDATDSFTIVVNPSVSIGDASVVRGTTGNRTMDFAVTLSQPSHTAVTVQYATADGTAKGGKQAGNGIDYQTKAGTLTFKPNAKTGLTPSELKVAVTVYPQPATNSNLSMQVALSAPTGGYSLARAVATGSVVNKATATTGIAIAPNAGIQLTTSGAAKLYVPITLSAPSSTAVAVSYTITLGTAAYTKTATGGDYGGSKTSGTLNFTVGSTGVTADEKTLAIPIWPDANTDPTETFTITITTTAPSTTAQITNAIATATINGDG
jgi:hypothetical protein